MNAELQGLSRFTFWLTVRLRLAVVLVLQSLLLVVAAATFPFAALHAFAFTATRDPRVLNLFHAIYRRGK